MKISGSNLMDELIPALGIKEKGVREITIRMEYDSVAEIIIRCFPDESKLKKATEIIKKYELIEKK